MSKIRILKTSFTKEEIKRLFDKTKKIVGTYGAPKEFLDDAIFLVDFLVDLEKYLVGVLPSTKNANESIIIARPLEGENIEVAEITKSEIYEDF
jgi:hypothetical protein